MKMRIFSSLSMNYIHQAKDSSLSQACKTGNVDTVRDLLATCCNVENYLAHKNSDGKTALHESCIYSQSECVRLLLGAGADPNSLKRGDWTPLMLACTRDSLDTIRLLVKAGGRLDIENKDGWNAFMIACRHGDVAILKYLLEAEPNSWQCVSRNGRTPLHTTAINDQSNALEFLLEQSWIAIDVQDVCGVSPLMDACRLPATDCLIRLLGHGGSTDILDKSGRTPLHIAAQSGSVACIRALLSRTKLKVNSKASSNGFTPLHYAMREGHAEAVSALVSEGASTAIRDSFGRTPTELAELCSSSKPNPESIKLNFMKII